MLLLGRRGNFCASIRLASQPSGIQPTSRCCPTTRIHRAAHTSLSNNISPYPFLNSAVSARLGSYKGVTSAGTKVPSSICARSSFNRVSLSMSSRRSKSSKSGDGNGSANGHVEEPLRNGNGSAAHNDEHTHDHDSHSHSHSHSIFGSHSHGEEGDDHGHEQIMQALQGNGE